MRDRENDEKNKTIKAKIKKYFPAILIAWTCLRDIPLMHTNRNVSQCYTFKWE